MQKTSNLFRSCFLLWLIFAAFAADQAQAQVAPATQYTVTPINVLSGREDYASYAYGISPDGQVTGRARTVAGTMNAFRYKDGVMINLGALNAWGSDGYSINNRGQVVGESMAYSSPSDYRAFLYSDGSMRDIGGANSSARGINASGHITGVASFTMPFSRSPVSRAFVYRDGVKTDIGTLCTATCTGTGFCVDCSSAGYAITDSGKVTGSSGISLAHYWEFHAFLYSNGKMTDLGTLGGTNSIGYGINDSGQVVGKSQIAGDKAEHAFLYSDGKMIDLGTLGGAFSEARGINANGDIVGFSTHSPNGSSSYYRDHHAFLYRNGVITDLNDLLPADAKASWTLNQAYGINDAGQIVGVGFHNGSTRAFLLSPIGDFKLSAASLSLVKGGAAGSYTMALANPPTADVVVTVSPGTHLTASPTQLTFTPANWNIPQTVTVQAIQNNISEGPHIVTLTHTAVSADRRYNGIAIGSVGVTITDPVVPVATIPVTSGTAWTNASLPVTGTAAPHATVTVTATNLTTGMVTAMSAVADANGVWSLTLAGLTNGNYELQPEAGGITGAKLTFAVGIIGSSPRPTLFLTGAAVYDINGSGAYIGHGVDTTGNNGAYNLYLLTGSGSFLNSGNGTATSLSLDISNPGTYKFFYRADGGGFNWPTPFAGLNLFFNKNSTPGISASVPFNVSNPALTAFGNGSLGIVNADILPGANTLSFMAGDLKVTLTAFSLIDYRNPSVLLATPDLVSPTNNVPNGINDYSGIITLQVSGTQASSDSLRPVLSPPVAEGGVWTQADVPLRGTAPPGSTVTIHIKGLHNGETSTRTVVADADGTWALLLPDLEDCHYELQAEVNGLFGNLLIVNVDSHAPMTTLSVGLGSGGGGSGGTGGASVGGWNSGPVTIGLSAVDGAAGQGVARIEYSLDGGAWTIFPSAGLTLGQDGTYNFCYRSTDKAGHVEQAHCVPLMIDATMPTVTPRFDAARNLLSLDATDGFSGIASLEISLDGGQSWGSSTGAVGFPRDGVYTVRYRCRDKAGNVTTGQTTVTVVTLPSLVPPPDQSAIEGRAQTFTLGSFADQGSDSPWRVEIDWGDGSNHDVLTVAAPGSLGDRMHAYADNGMYTVTLKVTDAAGNTGSKSFRVAVTNVAPAVGPIAAPAAPVAVNEAVTIRADFSDPGVLDTHTATIDWGDGTAGSGSVTEANGSGSVAGTHSYAAPGLYTVKVTVTDKDGGAGSSSYRYVVVVDPNGPFVTGSGQVDLPEGRAQFNFVVNYKGQAVPSGNGQFKLTSGRFDFRSSGYDWLVVNGGKAVFTGSGTINGGGDYGYMVSMIDAGSGKKGADAIRIRIWNKADGAVVYDTQSGTADTADPTLLFSGGNITIHE